jgi:hypothetical protein
VFEDACSNLSALCECRTFRSISSVVSWSEFIYASSKTKGCNFILLSKPAENMKSTEATEHDGVPNSQPTLKSEKISSAAGSARASTDAMSDRSAIEKPAAADDPKTTPEGCPEDDDIEYPPTRVAIPILLALMMSFFLMALVSSTAVTDWLRQTLTRISGSNNHCSGHPKNH